MVTIYIMTVIIAVLLAFLLVMLIKVREIKKYGSAVRIRPNPMILYKGHVAEWKEMNAIVYFTLKWLYGINHWDITFQYKGTEADKEIAVYNQKINEWVIIGRIKCPGDFINYEIYGKRRL